MVTGRTILKYIGGIKDGREKSVMAAASDSRQEYKSFYVTLDENGEEVENKVPLGSWDYDLPPNWIRCTYDQYKKVQDPTIGPTMQFTGSIERTRCSAITTKKVRCPRPAKGKSQFCHQHA